MFAREADGSDGVTRHMPPHTLCMQPRCSMGRLHQHLLKPQDNRSRAVARSRQRTNERQGVSGTTHVGCGAQTNPSAVIIKDGDDTTTSRVKTNEHDSAFRKDFRDFVNLRRHLLPYGNVD